MSGMRGDGMIADVIPERVAYTQLAEECTELAHAALKLGRYADSAQRGAIGNFAKDKWLENLYEEIADVMVCVQVVLKYQGDGEDPMTIIERIKKEKTERWCQRLGAKGE